MYKRTNILIMTQLFILGHVSYGLSKRLNLTQLIKENFASDQLHDIPVMRDISYLPEIYNVENAIKTLQSEQLNRDNRDLMSEYRNLCETVTKRVEMTDPDYEYQPPHYYQVFCKSYPLLDDNEEIMKRQASQQKCAYPGFHCVQRSRVLFLVRRRWDSECWELYTKEIASGCDCMWPVNTLQEITHHY